ncbi:MAG: CPBP family glutamic-type intramembrane protease [Anaerolineae bacterium]
MTFIEATERGKNALWRWILGLLTALGCWQVLGAGPLLTAWLWAELDGDPATRLDPTTSGLQGVEPLLGQYLLPNLSHPFFLLGIFVAVRVLLRRPLRTLVTPASRVRWRRIGVGFGLWLLGAALSAAVEALLYPGRFQWQNVDVGRYLLFLPLALIFTPLQTTTEELFFRGLLLQGTGRLVPWRWLAAAINGMLFALPHLLNPEVAQAPVLLMLYYFGLGTLLAWMTLRDGTAELALGAHAANNLFVALLINYENSALQTPALIISNHLDPLYNLISLLVMAAVFAIVAFHAGGSARPATQKEPGPD